MSDYLLFGCARDGCAEEVSYPVDMLREYQGRPYCQSCWDEAMPKVPVTLDDNGDTDEWLRWHDLPKYVPEYEKRIAELEQNLQTLRSGTDLPFPAVTDRHLLARVAQLTAELEGAEEKRDKLMNAAASAVEVAVRYGGIDGDHHKAWVIDQMVRVLVGGEYEKLVAAAKCGENGPNTYSWDVGIAP